MIRYALLFVLFAFPTVNWGQNASTAGEVLTLENAVALALENNRQIENAELEVKKAGDSVAIARSRFLPQISLGIFESYHLNPENFVFQEGVFGTYPIIGPIPAVDTAIKSAPNFTTLLTGTASQPLSQIYRITLDVKQRKVFKEITQEELRSQQQKVIDQVKELYYGILQTQSQLVATEETILFLKELDKLVERYVQVQRALESESLEVKTDLAKAEYNAFSDRNTLASRKEQLNYLLGRDITTEFSVSSVPEVTPYEVNLAQAQAEALAQRPEVRVAQLNVKRAEYGYSIKKSEFIPDISLQFRYISNFDIEFVPENTSTVGVFADWEVFDGGRKRKELAEKSTTILQAKNDLRQVQDQVVIDVNNQFRQLEDSVELVQVTEQARLAAQEKLRVTKNKYAEQSALLQDVLKAQASLADANSDYQQAVLGYWTARANLDRALGE